MKIHSFRVVPALPERLQGLRDIAYNLLWSWDDDLRVVFSRLDRDLWGSTYQNPVLMLVRSPRSGWRGSPTTRASSPTTTGPSTA